MTRKRRARQRSDSIYSRQSESRKPVANASRTLALALSFSERSDGEPIARFRPLHRPSHPKQHRDFPTTWYFPTIDRLASSAI